MPKGEEAVGALQGLDLAALGELDLILTTSMSERAVREWFPIGNVPGPNRISESQFLWGGCLWRARVPLWPLQRIERRLARRTAAGEAEDAVAPRLPRRELGGLLYRGFLRSA